MPICWGLFGCVEKRVNVFDLREGSVGWQQLGEVLKVASWDWEKNKNKIKG